MVGEEADDRQLSWFVLLFIGASGAMGSVIGHMVVPREAGGLLAVVPGAIGAVAGYFVGRLIEPLFMPDGRYGPAWYGATGALACGSFGFLVAPMFGWDGWVRATFTLAFAVFGVLVGLLRHRNSSA